MFLPFYGYNTSFSFSADQTHSPGQGVHTEIANFGAIYLYLLPLTVGRVGN